jgi:hypothetical protein
MVDLTLFLHFGSNNINKSHMLKISTVSLILLFCCIAHALRSSKTHTQDLKNDFCWKDSYGRGVGTIPNGCPSGYEMLGVLCYEACPSGY